MNYTTFYTKLTPNGANLTYVVNKSIMGNPPDCVPLRHGMLTAERVVK